MNMTQNGRSLEQIQTYRAHRAAHVLRKLGFTSRTQLRNSVDQYSGLRGIGPVLDRTLRQCINLPGDQWVQLFPGIEP